MVARAPRPFWAISPPHSKGVWSAWTPPIAPRFLSRKPSRPPVFTPLSVPELVTAQVAYRFRKQLYDVPDHAEPSEGPALPCSRGRSWPCSVRNDPDVGRPRQPRQPPRPDQPWDGGSE